MSEARLSKVWPGIPTRTPLPTSYPRAARRPRIAKRSDLRSGSRRVDRLVERGVRRLEAEEVAVGARLAPRGEVLVGPLAEAERDGEAGRRPDRADDVGHPAARQAVVLARLQDDGAVAEPLRRPGAGEDLVLRHPVAGQRVVRGRDAAVGAAPDAVVRDLDEAAQVDLVAHALAPHGVRPAVEPREAARVGLVKPGQDSGAIDHVVTSTGSSGLGAGFAEGLQGGGEGPERPLEDAERVGDRQPVVRDGDAPPSGSGGCGRASRGGCPCSCRSGRRGRSGRGRRGSRAPGRGRTRAAGPCTARSQRGIFTRPMSSPMGWCVHDSATRTRSPAFSRSIPSVPRTISVRSPWKRAKRMEKEVSGTPGGVSAATLQEGLRVGHDEPAAERRGARAPSSARAP